MQSFSYLMLYLNFKIGKIPKDKHLRKEVGLNEDNVLSFIDCVQTVLDLIMDANCSINEVPIFMFDQVNFQPYSQCYMNKKKQIIFSSFGVIIATAMI